ncbi:hypothetical protein KDA_66070 [Dictyobacter alpinus]|uniref:Uncharacterized protein n=1 Tax=Dictyobacter alpinus TaxID=2014873 RepID=A0A402BIB9_9CHLR|nr:hypothetical protein [Dictyobacter alpinus]GCE31123.1 hypothetical protein KDA_66070 [Dictyobacter alpinus]
MARRQRRPITHNQSTRSHSSVFIIWGILAVLGGISLFILNILFIFFKYIPAHPQFKLTFASMLTLISGTVIIEALLVILGILGIVIGRKLNKNK